MELKYNKLNRLLEVFYEYPAKKFTVRALAKITRMPTATVQIYLQTLRRDRLINTNNEAADTLLFRIKKINYFIEKIVSSGLLEYLIQTYRPSCIIIFGSMRKGDSTRESDIDIFVETAIKIQPTLEKFEKFFHHKIQLFIEPNIRKLPKNLLTNVINGIKVYGSFELV